MKIMNECSFYLNYVGFGGHMDMEMLEVGNNLMGYMEERSHFAIWAIVKAPLLMGTDLRYISADSLNILKAKTLLNFNQDDVYGGPAKPFKWGSSPDWTYDDHHPPEYYSGRFKDGILLALFNSRDENWRYMDFEWSQIPELQMGKSYRIFDGWDDTIEYGCYEATEGKPFYVGPVTFHDTALLILKEDWYCEIRNKYSPKKRTIQSDLLVIEDTQRRIQERGKV
jgi:alpha-galactosidase